MKLFTQLALVSAIASCGSAYAMQSMDDSALSDTTGQDGITILSLHQQSQVVLQLLVIL